jgi:hypothetical protein
MNSDPEESNKVGKSTSTEQLTVTYGPVDGEEVKDQEHADKKLTSIRSEHYDANKLSSENLSSDSREYAIISIYL